MADFMSPAPAPETPLGQHRILATTAGIRVSPLMLGGMSIGDKWSFMGQMNKQQAFSLLDAYYKAGGNVIDTANAYHDGQSEEWIGEWAADKRDNLIIATKFSFQYKAADNSQKTPAVNNHWGNSKKSMTNSVTDSLKKLNTPYIDILYVHWWDFTTSIEEVMDSLHLLVLQGKVLYLGISDTPAWVAAAANTYARDHGKTQFSVIQGKFNLLNRDLEREILPMATHFGMAVAPWDVLGSGRFMSKQQLEERKKNGEQPRFGAEISEEEMKVSEALSSVAEARNVSIQSIALAYVRSKSNNIFPLVGGRKVEHLHDNIKALNIKLTEKEIEQLESKLSFDIGFPANFTGQDYHTTGRAGPMLQAQGILSVP